MQIEPLRDDDLPPLYRTADVSSLSAQTRYLNATKFRLVLLCLAAAFGLFAWHRGTSPTDWAGVLATACFGITLILEIYILAAKPDRTWYEGRAAAESAKTLSWRYAVGGEPFGRASGMSDPQVDDLFLTQLHSVLDDLRDLDVTALQSVGQQISDKMRHVRNASLDDRKATYEKYRVGDQLSWYSRSARWNRTRATMWSAIIVFVEIIGLLAGILKAVGSLEVDFLAFAGAVVAAMAAWLQTKQHREIATAYTITALELASVQSKIQHQTSEASWAGFVGDAEEAFSREHTLWKASRGVHSM